MIRINLPEGTEHFGHTYVVCDTADEHTARLMVVRATGVAVAKQGAAFQSGFISEMGYSATRPADVEAFETWIPMNLARAAGLVA